MAVIDAGVNMAGIQDPKLDLWYGWNEDESGLKDQLDANWRKLGVLIQLRVIDRTHTAPPSTPADGDTYIVKATATGVWVGQENNIAVWRAALGVWEFYVAKNGYVANIRSEGTLGKLSTFDGTAWSTGLALA